MDRKIKTTYFKPDTKGVAVTPDSVCFCTDQVSGSDCGVILYDKNNESIRIPFSEQGRRGRLYGVKIHFKDMIRDLSAFRYQYYCGNEIFVDQYARIFTGGEKWGESRDDHICGGFYIRDFDWEKDKLPETPFADSIIYGLHVRGFTMHKSSGVKKRGTFEGMTEKIPYLKALGITAVELLPAYEFNEYEPSVNPVSEPGESMINCWGFKQGGYYAPKSAYSADKRPDHSFKRMVKEFHKAGIEVLMYFYFPTTFNRSDITDVLRHWVVEYHIDGVHLLGAGLPLAVITQDTLLSGIKILYNEYSYWEEASLFPNTGVFKDHFRTQMRRLLKGDDDLIQSLLYHQRNNPNDRGIINYMADYGGFTLFDMTAYDKKHNEANGEDNRDGTDNNYSWNCGAEGPSRKKAVMELRTRQIKNALAFIFLAQGTPFLFSGDEFCNTRFGNNNVYCQDNEAGWIKWNLTAMGKEISDFIRFLIDFRRKHPILHMPAEMYIMDTAKCGYPDVSYHGEEAWRPDLTPSSRTAGIMYCGKYAENMDGSEDDFLYVAINMYWFPRKLGLPNLPKDMEWRLIQSTHPAGPEPDKDESSQSMIIKGRSICIFQSFRRVERKPLIEKKLTNDKEESDIKNQI